MENNKFTNKQELEYPTEEDFVDVKVLNNNTRILSKQKADIADIEVSLQGLAKERSEYSIEDKVKNLEDNISKFYYDLTQMVVSKQISNISTSQEILLGEITGEGELIHCYLDFQGIGSSSVDTPTFKFKIVVDGQIKVFHNVCYSGNNQLADIGFFSKVNILSYRSNKRQPTSTDTELFPTSFLPFTKHLSNGQSQGTNKLIIAPRNYIMHPISPQEKKLYVNGIGSEMYCTQGTLELKPIKYKNKVQIYFTLLDKASLSSMNLTAYFSPKGV